MTPSLAWHRVYFLIVSGFTAWVGFFGFFRPHEILRALPWPMPPLHARFVGALYLSATVFLLLALFARSRAHVRTIVVIAFAWTGWLLLITLVHHDTFDPTRIQVWYWIAAYVSFPIAAAWLAWARPARPGPGDAPIANAWVIGCLRAQGVVLVALAVALVALPGWIVTLWPWKITPFLSQVYSGPVLGYGIGSLTLASRRNWPETLIPMIGQFMFAALALIGSSWHLALFSSGSASQFIWFASLIGLATIALVLLVGALRHPVFTPEPADHGAHA